MGTPGINTGKRAGSSIVDAAPEDRGNRANQLVYFSSPLHLLLPAFDSLSPLVLAVKLFAATGLLLLSLSQ